MNQSVPLMEIYVHFEDNFEDNYEYNQCRAIFISTITNLNKCINFAI